LTANLQLQHCYSRSCIRFAAEASKPHLTRAARDPGGASIESSFARRLPAAAFSSACGASSVASDVLCRGSSERGSTLRSSPPVEAARPRLHRRLVKDSRFVETRTPSLDECSLPRSGSCRARGLRRAPDPPRPRLSPLSPGHRLAPAAPRARDHREPATVLAVLPPRAGFRRPFTIRARGRVARPERYERSDQTPLVDFCNQNNPRAQPRDRPIPGSRLAGAAPPACAGFGELPPRMELRPHPPRRLLSPGDTGASTRRAVLANCVEAGFCSAPAEVSRARGRTAMPTGASRHLASR